jgi:hypothetical protein
MAALVVLSHVSAQTADPFVGTWRTNIDKSSYDPPSMRPQQPSILTRVVAGDGFTVTSVGRNGEGVPTSIAYTFTPDGRDYPLKGTSSADSVAVVRVDARTQVQIRKKGGTVIAMYRQTISADGKTLTSAEVGYRIGGAASHNVLVFDRQ